MARICKLTGKKPLVGYNVSHSHNKTKRRQYPNLQTKRIYVDQLGRSVRVKLSARALKTVTRDGLLPYLKKNGLLQLVARHQKGGKSLEKKMKEVFGNVKVVSRKSGYRVYVSTT